MNLRVSLCQTEAAWRDPIGNLRRAEPLVAAAAADLVVLPELFATGFDVAAAAAEPEGGPVAGALRGWALRYGRAIAGSVAVREADGTLRNRMYFVRPSGEAEWYDKRHLFRPGGEAAAYAPGSERRVVHYRGWRLLLLVCYDLRFPVWSRSRGDYDAIIYCASWDNKRRDAWCALLRARAIENQCYVIGVNRVGTDPDAVYIGDSQALDYLGRTIAGADSGEWTMSVTLDLEQQRAFRESFPAWQDADDFRLEP